jgi:undecaprenyl-diphosphatase
MLEYLNNLDTRILLLLNGLHSTPTDYIMLFFSNRPIWIPLYLFLIYGLFRRYGKKFWIPLTGAIILIALVDQGTVHLFKNVFMRLRPCHEPSLEGKLHLLDGVCRGQFGFISSHAANTFALAVFMFGFLRKQSRWLAISLLVWAGIVSYSRIYLGVHYPGDVICGAAFGAGLGYLIRLTVKRFGQLGPEQVL